MGDEPAAMATGGGAWDGLPPGGGETGRLLREADWRASPLGPPARWPPALGTLVALMLGSRQPMFVAWGPERILLYNDYYAPMCGARHPAAMGRPIHDVWHDILDDVGPLFEAVFAGESVHREDLELTTHRHGYPEVAHFTFSYSPVRGADGAVEGLFCVCDETTERVQAERRRAFLVELDDALRPLGDPLAIQREAARRLGRTLGANRAGYAELDGGEAAMGPDYVDGVAPLGGRVRIADFGAALAERLRQGAPVAVEDVERDLSLSEAERAAFRAAEVRAFLGVTLVKDGEAVAAFGAQSATPRRWSGHDRALVAATGERTWAAVERARAETATRESALRFRTLAESITDVFYITEFDPPRLLYLSPSFARVWGRPVADLLADAGGFFATLHPDDRERLLTGVAEQRRGEPTSHEYRILRPDGAERWILDRSYPVPGFEGRRSAGTAIDVTERKAAEAAQRESEARLRHVLDSVKEYAVIALDAGGRITGWNAGAERLLGYGEGEAVGLSGAVFFTPEDRASGEFDAEMAAAAATGRGEHERWHVRRDGSRFWGSGVMSPLEDPAGGFVKVFRDRTAERNEEERRRLLTRELHHRVKNTLATVQAIASQTFRAGEGLDDARAAFGLRLRALASAHDVLTQESWVGAELRAVADAALAPFDGDEAERIAVGGPPLYLTPRAAVAGAMALHELAANAIRHGALSAPEGRVDLVWTLERAAGGERLRLEWREAGGPPAAAPARRGFGLRLIEASLATEFGATLRLDFPASGLVCVVEARADRLRPVAPLGAQPRTALTL